MKTFHQWLKLKEINMTPMQVRQTFGNIVGAQQPNDPNQVANGIIKNTNDKQLLGSLAINPILATIRDKLMNAQQKNDPNQARNINTNVVGNTLSAASTAGTASAQ